MFVLIKIVGLLFSGNKKQKTIVAIQDGRCFSVFVFVFDDTAPVSISGTVSEVFFGFRIDDSAFVVFNSFVVVVVVYVVYVFGFFRGVVDFSDKTYPKAPCFRESLRLHIGSEFYPFFPGGFRVRRYGNLWQRVLCHTAGKNHKAKYR